METDIIRCVALGLKRSKILIDRSPKNREAAARYVAKEMIRDFEFKRRPKSSGHKTLEMD